MTIEIKRLTPALADDYFHFFDHVAFADHQEWSWCYCTFYHMDGRDEMSDDITKKEDLRDLAARLIADGRMQGYLAYADGQVVGWCNAGDRDSFKRLVAEPNLWTAGIRERVLSVVCFIIAANMRRRGIARQLLKRVMEDAAAEGFIAVEAYPVTGKGDAYIHYHGHASLYEQYGFLVYKKMDGYAVMRKPLTA